MSFTKRLRKELTALQREPIDNISARPSSYSDLRIWTATIKGPEKSVYEGGYFGLILSFPTTYPFSPPSVTFSTRIYHPNVDKRGNICLDLLQEDNWSATMTIQKLLLSLSSLLSDPNFDDPIEYACAELYKSNPRAYRKRARLWTRRYAMEDVWSKYSTEETGGNPEEQGGHTEIQQLVLGNSDTASAHHSRTGEELVHHSPTREQLLHHIRTDEQLLHDSRTREQLVADHNRQGEGVERVCEGEQHLEQGGSEADHTHQGEGGELVCEGRSAESLGGGSSQVGDGTGVLLGADNQEADNQEIDESLLTIMGDHTGGIGNDDVTVD